MSKIDLISHDWVDLVFEGRNQAYGAYKLRKGTTKRNIIAIIAVIVLLVIGFVILTVKNIVDEQRAKVAITQVTELTALNQPKKKAEVKQKKVEAIPEKVVERVKSSIKFTAPIIKKDEEVKPEDESKTQDQLNESKTAIGTFDVKGVHPDYFQIETQKLFHGRLLNEVDERERRKVCLIGTKVKEVLFKEEDPCGSYIRVNGIYYQVVGVVQQRASGVNIGGRSEESVFLPFSTMQQTLNQGDIIHFLCVAAKPDVQMLPVINKIKSIIKEQNFISPTDPQAVSAINLAAQFETFNNAFLGIDILIWIVGVGTLLAGIIGVSNIMMVTVKERTKEIGVRRALGAKPWNIISQIMSESLLITAMAGLMGLTVGVFLLDMVDQLIGDPVGETMLLHPAVSIQVALAATSILLLAGLLAGLIPAWRAMQIKAIDAIREE